jgi:hypothetical protein
MQMNYFYNCGTPGPRDANQSGTQPIMLINSDRTGNGSIKFQFNNNHFQGGRQSNPETFFINNLGPLAHNYDNAANFDANVELWFDNNWSTTNWQPTYTNSIWPDSESIGMRAQTWEETWATQFDLAQYPGSPLVSPTWLPQAPWQPNFLLLPPTQVKQRALSYAGCKPANRTDAQARMVSEIEDESFFVDMSGNGSRRPYPLPAEVTEVVDVPDIGTGNFQGGPNHPAIAGYDTGAITPLEAWLHGKHMAALGIPNGASNYDPNVVAKWIAQ